MSKLEEKFNNNIFVLNNQKSDEIQRRMSENVTNEQKEEIILQGRERSKTLINPYPLKTDLLTPDGKMLINFGSKLRSIISNNENKQQKQKLNVPSQTNIRNCKSFDDVIETNKLNNNNKRKPSKEFNILERKEESLSSATTLSIFPSPFSKFFRLRAKSDVNCSKRERIYKEEKEENN